MPRRAPDQLRQITITPHFLAHPEGSVLIAAGDTKVICTASIDEKTPPWLNGKGQGWVTAEYDMLPRATNTRRDRDAVRGKVNGRTQEISRLIGRALRAGIDLTALGERTITIDCDVIQADGGTRTAAITGGWTALAIALSELQKKGKLKKSPIRDHIVAISAGIVDDEPRLDLDYSMDARAGADVNIVMTGSGALVEVQGTAEGKPFARKELDILLDLAFKALPDLVAVQKRAAETPFGSVTNFRIATTNEGKLREFVEMLAPLGYTVRGVADLPGFDVDETGDTFEANAILKAEALLARTGEPALGDDSGLAVDALGGRPGVYSARYGGVSGAGKDAANRAKLVRELEDVPDAKRTARFVCVLAYSAPGKKPLLFRGECEGRIGHTERGANGFGYDPLFVVESGLTVAELPSDEKNRISHRGRALAKLLAHLKKS